MQGENNRMRMCVCVCVWVWGSGWGCGGAKTEVWTPFHGTTLRKQPSSAGSRPLIQNVRQTHTKRAKKISFFRKTVVDLTLSAMNQTVVNYVRNKKQGVRLKRKSVSVRREVKERAELQWHWQERTREGRVEVWLLPPLGGHVETGESTPQ